MRAGVVAGIVEAAGPRRLKKAACIAADRGVAAESGSAVEAESRLPQSVLVRAVTRGVLRRGPLGGSSECSTPLFSPHFWWQFGHTHLTGCVSAFPEYGRGLVAPSAPRLNWAGFDQG